MKALIVGATGFIGSRLASAFTAAGHEVFRVSRHTEPPLDYARLPSDAALQALVRGCDVVINAVGILRERDGQTFTALHEAGPQALFTACAAAGVPRVIQISALGAGPDASTRYYRSKHVADRYLMALALDWAVVRPSLVYGRGGASARLFDALASLPITPLPAGGTQAVQPVHIDDLVAAVLALAESPATLRCVLPVVGPAPLRFRQFLADLRSALGEPPARAIAIPRVLMATAARAGDLWPGSLLDRESLDMLERGNTADAAPLRQWLGRAPRSVREFIVADEARAHHDAATLTWLLPLLRLAVAAMWFAAAIVSLGPYPVADSLALLRSIGATPSLAPLMLGAAVALDFTLGVLTLWPRRARWLWSAQILLVIGYTAIISWKLPALWLEPFGPVAKNLPILGLLLLLRQLDRRA